MNPCNRHTNGKILTLVIVSLAVVGPAATVQAFPIPSFQGLGDLPGGSFSSGAFDVSADGAVVVGFGRSASGLEAFRWTADGGMVGLGDLPGGTFNSEAFATSADGAVIVGRSRSASGQEAFRWTAAGGMVGLGDLPGGTFDSEAWATSADGSVVAGFGHSASGFGGRQAFRWTAADGMVGLGDLPGGSLTFGSVVTDMSVDGSVLVGQGRSASGNEAFRWTAADGMIGLGDLPGGSFDSAVWATSADGAVVVGFGSSAASGFFAHEASRWTAADGMVGLGDLPGGTFDSEAFATSADGSVVVGQGRSTSGQAAFLWTANQGMRSLQDILTTDFGLDLAGWQLLQARGISGDGRTIVGWGFNPSGFGEAWIATIPEPATLSLLALGGLLLPRRRLRA